MKKDLLYQIVVNSIIIVVLLLLVSSNLVFVTALGENSGPEEKAAAKEAGEKNPRKRKIYYESNRNYLKLPDLGAADPAVLAQSWTNHRYGVDENPRGIIGSAVASYAFRVPKGWKVQNTFRRFSQGENMVVFRLEGGDGIWGSITKVELSGKSISNEKEFALYYNKRKSSFVGLLDGIEKSEVTAELHLLQGFSSIRTDSIEYYESYSTVGVPEGDYSNISQYKLQAGLGYVIDVYIPSDKLSRDNRSLAFVIGRSFRVYRFG